VDTLISGTLYVFLDIRDFSSTEIKFEPRPIKWICRESVSGLPNSSALLDEVLKSCEEPEGWIEKLLFHVTNKRYLFLFIDEIGYLSTSFRDLRREDQKQSKSFRLFFWFLSRVVSNPRVICVVAGRTESISRRIDEASSSPLELKYVGLSPFSKDVVKSFIQGTTCSKDDGEPVLKILFPSHPEGPEWFFQKMYIYSGGVFMYLIDIFRELVDLRKSKKGRDLSENDMEVLIDSIPTNTSVLIISAHMSSETMNVFCSMLLAAVLELRIKQDSFVSIHGRERFLLDVANVLSFYCTAVSAEEKELS